MLGFLLGLLFELEDGGNMFLQITIWISLAFMALYPEK
jgi:hypothetical protein